MTAASSPPQPLLLGADNFTPPTRTPWGGQEILRVYKANATLDEPARSYPAVGESWEVSVEPDFPSRLAGNRRTLAEAIEADPVRWLGSQAAAEHTNALLLVKLLDAAEHLSVQIHPADDFPELRAHESGKPEAWYVLARERNAGIYLGLRTGVQEDQLRRAIEEADDVSRLLFFVPVEAGDFFLIEAGMPHAIGAGVTLVEPQRVQPGKRGVTYRYWDWNRRYDDQGRRDPHGKPRPLHIEEALAVTDFGALREEELLSAIRVRSGCPELDGSPTYLPLTPPGVRDACLRVGRLSGTGAHPLPDSEDCFRGVTVVAGTVEIAGDFGHLAIPTGHSAALPASLTRADLHLDGAHAILCAAT